MACVRDFWDDCEGHAQRTGTLIFDMTCGDSEGGADDAAGPLNGDDSESIVDEFCRRLVQPPSCDHERVCEFEGTLFEGQVPLDPAECGVASVGVFSGVAGEVAEGGCAVAGLGSRRQRSAKLNFQVRGSRSSCVWRSGTWRFFWCCWRSGKRRLCRDRFGISTAEIGKPGELNFQV
jgi:hypothetical protein